MPVKQNRILFFAGARGYICNPKYVAEYLNDHYPGQFELCWIGTDEKQLEGRDYITFVNEKSPISLWHALASSHVFVTNGENAICPKSKKRLIICTWHGAAYKKVGFDTNDRFAKNDTAHSAIDILLSISDEYTEHLIKSGFHYKGRVLNSGYPRNDIFFDSEKAKEASDRVRKHYSIHGKVVLFAPTYRGVYQTANKVDFRLDFNRLKDALTKRYGNDVQILARMHYFDKNAYTFPEDVIDAGDWPDMNELLCATDILITDYSSTIWDFAMTKRPCLLYTPDLEQYKEERGIYTDPKTWPGILCMSMDQLCGAITNLDEEKCADKTEKYLKDMGSYEDGTASKQVANEIVKYLGVEESSKVETTPSTNGDTKKMKRVITYGTFDLLHYGHINLLRRAKALGDYLIVALSTDEFNWNEKHKKTYFTYEQRKQLLEAIRYVDLVIPEEGWKQKRNDIHEYHIDTFVMGDDWKGKFDFLKEEGAEVVYLPRTPEVSSSKIKHDLYDAASVADSQLDHSNLNTDPDSDNAEITGGGITKS